MATDDLYAKSEEVCDRAAEVRARSDEAREHSAEVRGRAKEACKRAEAIRARTALRAARILADMLRGPPAGPVLVEVRVSVGGEVVFSVEAGQSEGGSRFSGQADTAQAVSQANGQPAGQSAAQVSGETADLIRAVLRAEPGPLKLATVARRAGHDLTSHFRKVAYAMHAAGELVHHEGHRYSLRTQ